MPDIVEQIWPSWMQEGRCFGSVPSNDRHLTLRAVVALEGGKERLECGHYVEPLFSSMRRDEADGAPSGSYRRSCEDCGGSVDVPENIWMPRKGGKAFEQAQEAKDVCNGGEDEPPCPVRDECLEFALDNSIHLGVWGGLSPDERARLRRRGRRTRQGLPRVEEAEVLTLGLGEVGQESDEGPWEGGTASAVEARG